MPMPCGACERQQTATQALSARGARLTELRRDVLQALHHSERPLGAYDLFDVLKRKGRASAPPAVYRVLDFLVGQGLVHKLQSLGAYTACSCAPQSHRATFFICHRCGQVEEDAKTDTWKMLNSAAETRGFQIEHLNVEAIGLCHECALP